MYTKEKVDTHWPSLSKHREVAFLQYPVYSRFLQRNKGPFRNVCLVRQYIILVQLVGLSTTLRGTFFEESKQFKVVRRVVIVMRRW